MSATQKIRGKFLSSGCAGIGCIQVIHTGKDEIRIRASGNPNVTLKVTVAEWEAFVAKIKSGEFNPMKK